MMPLARHHGQTAAAVVVFLATARLARTHRVAAIEEQVFRAVNNGPDRLNPPVWALMQSGSLAAVFVAAGRQYLTGANRKALASLVTGVTVWGGVKVVKPLIGRGRPDQHLHAVSVRGQPQTGLGYPSGHAAVVTTLAIIATRDSSPLARLAAAGVAGGTGAGRMYAGAHLPLDVAGGTAIGVLCGRMATTVLRQMLPRSTA